MNIFTDYHHGDLLHSLHLLFEKRLGHNLYCPIGRDWYDEGYWKIADVYEESVAKQVINQYLDYGSAPIIDATAVGAGLLKKIENRIFELYYEPLDTCYKSITLKKFKKMNIDIVISSIPKHDIAFAKLIKKYMPDAKHISQMGNLCPQNDVPNVMCSFPESLYNPKVNQNVVYYDQEFELAEFQYIPPTNDKKINGMVNMFPLPELFQKYKSELSEFEFKSYGSGAPDGALFHPNIGKVMADSTFGWHVKPGGDGYGHILHNWLACGRPVITCLSDYSHLENLLIPGTTCIDLEANSFEQNIELIREYSEPSVHKKMCEQTYKIFSENVDFDVDAQKIEKFLERLL